ncbi:MAG: DUF4397 domain-containing protein [Chloroflexi bacterium]|nr:DUF4397 domain-containing protein [Chloroflexota bacterium]
MLLPDAVGAQSPEPTTSAPSLRIVLAPTVAPLVDVYLDGVPMSDLTDFTPGSISPYAAVPEGEHDVDVFPDAADPLRSEPLLTAVIDFDVDGARTLAVRGDATAMRVEPASAQLACPGSVAIIRAGTVGGPPLDYTSAAVVRSLRGEHHLIVDSVPVATTGARYPALCGQPSDRLWYRVRSVDGARVNGWIAMPLPVVFGHD